MLEHVKTIELFIKEESFSGILLFTATILAVIVANSPLGADYFALWQMNLGMAIGEKTISMNAKEVMSHSTVVKTIKQFYKESLE